jgi:putative ABC transport system permease protein
VGLSVSIVIFLALTGYVNYQFSFDKFYPGGDRIYRINYFEYEEGQAVLESARTHDRTAWLVHEYVPQVEAVARAYNEKAFVFSEDVRIVDQDMMFADSSFLKVFPLNLISGSADDGLKAPHTALISRSQAQVYFGDDDPMGKILYFNEHLPFTITGVFEDIPENNSFNFDFLLSWSTMTYNGWVSRDGTFETPWTFTFVRLKESASDIAAVNRGLTAMAMEHITHLEKRGHTARHELQSYEELHTSRALSGEMSPTVSRTLLYALLSLAAFIVIAAWINYVNLSIARLLERSGEIGVRKVFGGSRLAISGQFLIEAFILSCVTFILGLGLFYLFSGSFATHIFERFAVPMPEPGRLALYFVLFTLGTTLVAFYPAHFMSRFKPVLILRNKLGSGKGRTSILHQSLMAFQLFLAVAVVGITLIAGRQISFMRQFDSGFNTHNAITLRAPASTNSDSLRYTRYTQFRAEVLQLAGFISGTASMNIPGQEIRFHDEGVHAVGSSNLKKQSYWVMMIDEGYQETFGLTLIAGRNFNQKEFGNTVVINETAARALGYADPAGAVNTEIITNDNKTYTVIGVWKDYHHESVRKTVDPILFFHRHPWEYGYYSFNVASAQGDYLDKLEGIWRKHYPHDQFVYYFMDSFFAQQYAADQFFGKLLGLFSVISILVASLGLFGMATLSIVKRTKEIAVRKVLGATIPGLLFMLSKTYVKLIVIGCVFAFPLAYYLTHQWLNGFVYKIAIEWWMIVVPGILVLFTTLVTIAGQSFRAARTNPADSLRDG